jgi:hypothetical protein
MYDFGLLDLIQLFFLIDLLILIRAKIPVLQTNDKMIFPG